MPAPMPEKAATPSDEVGSQGYHACYQQSLMPSALATVAPRVVEEEEEEIVVDSEEVEAEDLGSTAEVMEAVVGSVDLAETAAVSPSVSEAGAHRSHRQFRCMHMIVDHTYQASRFESVQNRRETYLGRRSTYCARSTHPLCLCRGSDE